MSLTDMDYAKTGREFARQAWNTGQVIVAGDEFRGRIPARAHA